MQHNTIVSLVGLVAVAAAVVEKVFNIELMKNIKTHIHNTTNMVLISVVV